MQVLLLKSKEDLGNGGDLVTVADGYARNFLLPKKFCVKATKNTLELQKKLIAQREIKAAEELESYKVLGDKISNLSLTVPAKVGDDDQLYGSVTAADIVKLLKDEGIEIDRKNVLLEAPIKNLGVYAVEFALHADVKATMKLWVVKE